MRLDRRLSESGLGSRKEVKVLIKKGQVMVNETIVKDVGRNVQDTDVVNVAGTIVGYQPFQYYLLNKPAGYLTATKDSRAQTIMDLVPIDLPHYRDLAPVGRLDRDTTGLLLLTNDGQLAHRLLAPKYHVTKTYRALVSGLVADELVAILAKGVKLSDFTTQPAQLKIIQRDVKQQQTQVELTITEGKYHQVKRMLLAFDHEVLQLERVAFGPLRLTDLPQGQFHELTESELAALRRI
ncbi:pseudouridine synthase [Lapidilactobacillus bayanensis]|uniref:pseudouridine synthase n=1 Tax=Lapidilactobacillus bayanensis TaxID=2485998 RepID=UPI000F7BA8E7|nr:pseudouridine synthase [Lapidilactobacillus bayanensis]